MTNPVSDLFNDTRETLTFIIFVILIIFILATLGVAFGMPEFTNSLINSIGLGTLLVLAIPPIGFIIAIIIWIKKATEPIGI